MTPHPLLSALLDWRGLLGVGLAVFVIAIWS